ncbi:hypothetical protein [Amycolatopsis sp. lyj-346]|uniref:hypothetical protein n=1 Tax=Amycolatopsis sp. lyj-346 TaxID=2789289 RepID=UPI0039786992
MRFGKIDVRYLGAVLALAFILLIVMSVVLDQGADWWSAWGQWVGGIGSIVAAAVAVWIAQRGWAIAAAEKSDNEAIQARLIRVEYTTQNGGAATIKVVNRSGGFIGDVTIVKIEARIGAELQGGRWMHKSATTAAPDIPLPSLIAEVVDPHEANAGIFLYRKTPNQLTQLPDTATVTFSFSDADGRLWERTGMEQPRRL